MFTQKKDELIRVVAEAMKNSGRTCDDTNWHIVLAKEAIRGLYANGYAVVLEPKD